MRIVDIHYVKTHLSRLVEKAAKGQSFIIAKAGKPMAKVIPVGNAEAGTMSRLGFMAGECAVPGAFDQMSGDEIARLFGVKYGDGVRKV